MLRRHFFGLLSFCLLSHYNEWPVAIKSQKHCHHVLWLNFNITRIILFWSQNREVWFIFWERIICLHFWFFRKTFQFLVQIKANPKKLSSFLVFVELHFILYFFDKILWGYSFIFWERIILIKNRGQIILFLLDTFIESISVSS